MSRGVVFRKREGGRGGRYWMMENPKEKKPATPAPKFCEELDYKIMAFRRLDDGIVYSFNNVIYSSV